MFKHLLANKWFVFSVTAILVVIVCQLTRLYFVDTVILNPGIAFNLKPPTMVVYGLSAALLAVVIAWHAKGRPDSSHNASFGLIVGGGLSNLIDRLILKGNVADYIDLGAGFVNLADVAIACGIVVALWCVYTDEH
jgi:lipoprotein signal peptidase